MKSKSMALVMLLMILYTVSTMSDQTIIPNETQVNEGDSSQIFTNEQTNTEMAMFTGTTGSSSGGGLNMMGGGPGFCENASNVDIDGDSYTCVIDCNDNDAAINPGATETCGDIVDMDCDGEDSNGYFVGDGCGEGSCSGVVQCNGLYETKCSTYTEDCGTCCMCDVDGIEDFDPGQWITDCNPTDCSTLENGCGIGGCSINIYGFYPASVPNTCLSVGQCTYNDCSVTCEDDYDGDSFSPTCGDCNDTEWTVHPQAYEVCGDGIDQDCNGEEIMCWQDWDMDGYTYEIDCNDYEYSVNPGAEEICNMIDDNCNGGIDDNLFQYFGSDIGECMMGTEQCILGTWIITDPGVNESDEICMTLNKEKYL